MQIFRGVEIFLEKKTSMMKKWTKQHSRSWKLPLSVFEPAIHFDAWLREMVCIYSYVLCDEFD